MRQIYLIASIAGAILPLSLLIPFVLANEIDISLLIEDLLQSELAVATLVDMLISSIVFWLFLFNEGRKLGMSNLWIYIPLNLFIGLSLALPLFLYFREGRLEQTQARPG